MHLEDAWVVDQQKYGSFTDISVLAPAFKVAAVNFSIGYLDEHTVAERLHVDWMFETIEKTTEILHTVAKLDKTIPVYEYIEAPYSYSKYASLWYDYDKDLVVPEGQDHCVMCNVLEKTEDMLPIYYPWGGRAYKHYMCLDCYSQCFSNIVWCQHCGRGYYFNASEIQKITNTNEWVCEDCKNGLKENSATVQQSDSVQSGPVTL